MAVKIQKILPEHGRRVIAISDIHGNLQIFKALLEQVGFSKDDILVLLGDVVEKGPDSIETLRYVMELSRLHTVYAVLGNCDVICLELMNEEQNEALLHYILSREHTLIGEMCRAQGIELFRESDMKKAKKELLKCYEHEVGFVHSQPHILKLGDLTFAHAAIFPVSEDKMDVEKVMKIDNFMNMGFRFDKFHIVGHWPVVLYCRSIQNNNPRFDKRNKIISIDGGNVLKRDGQLNALILPDAYSEEFSFQSADELPKAKALTVQEESRTSFNIRWIDSGVTPLKQEDDLILCRHNSTGYQMWIPDSYLYEKADGWHTEDISDYYIAIKEGDILSVSEETNQGYLVKKDGISGWFSGKLKYLS